MKVYNAEDNLIKESKEALDRITSRNQGRGINGDKKFKSNTGNKTKYLVTAVAFLGLFIVWTILLLTIDVRLTGVHETQIGFATLNHRFHELTGVNMGLYYVTDWLSLVPAIVCICFAVLGLVQWIKRKSPVLVDCDILLLGVYYVVVFVCYFVFEVIPINYRPILIEGQLEVSYPSSTTLLVLCVMPTLVFQICRRTKNRRVKRFTQIFVTVFCIFMVMARLLSGVHWITDILGGIWLALGLYYLYKTAIWMSDNKRKGR